MGIIETLRRKEAQGKRIAMQAVERARDFGEDVERRLRRNMRIYPQPAATPSEVSQAMPVGEITAEESAAQAQNLEAKPIISIRGEDVDQVA